MLTRADNELLSQTGAHTPMGQMLRRFWIPFAETSELPAPDCDPIEVRLLGEKLVLNEFFAYSHLGELRDAKVITNERTLAITAYALCGFANFASVGIQVAGIAILAPKQRENLATLAWRALLGGTLACLMTASVVGLLL